MNTIVQQSLPESVGFRIRRRINQIGVTMLAAACLTATLSPNTASATPGPVTQLQYIQSMVQALGDAGRFNAGSTAADYVQWAVNRGMQPRGGWTANATISVEAVALTWVQLLGLNPNKFQGNYFRNLDSAGFHIDPTAQVTADFINGLFDQPGRPIGCNTSPTKPGNGVGFGLGWYKKSGIPPAIPPGPPAGAGGNGRGSR